MLFSTTLTVPAATPASAPAKANLPVAHGILHRVDITFLDGPENEVHVILRSAGLHQIVPTSEGSVVGNARSVTAILHYELVEAQAYVVLEAWSPNADYAHEIAVEVHVLPRDVVDPPHLELGLLQRLSQVIFGRS